MSSMEHFDRELLQLDQQIVRLGLLCGLDMMRDENVTAVLSGKIGPQNISPEMRKSFMLMKGLLELRYIVEKHCVDDVGSGECRDILQNTLLK